MAFRIKWTNLERAVSHPQTRRGFAACFSIALILAPGPARAFGQEGIQPATQVTLSELLEDTDGDLIPDRLGGRFRVEGYATMEVRLARGTGPNSLYLVSIEDGSAGVRILGRDPDVMAAIKVGSQVVAWGTLTHRRGAEELMLDSLEVLPSAVPVQPLDVLAQDVLGEAVMHRLVRLAGVFTEYDPLEQRGILEDRTGTVEVRIPTRFRTDEEFVSLLQAGGEAVVTGVVSQADREAPYDDDYRLLPRSPEDVIWIQTPPYLEMALIVLFLTLASGMISFSIQRRRAVQRSKELEALTGDLNEAKEAQAAVAEEFRSLFDDDVAARFVLDEEGRVRRWNPALEAFLGLEAADLAGTPLFDLLSVSEGSAGLDPGPGGLEQVEVTVERPEAQARHGLLGLSRRTAGGAVESSGAIVDTTDRRELEAQVARADRMAALGRLAGGIAHKLNNALSTIVGNTDLLLLEKGEGFGEDELDEIREAAFESAKLTNRLLIMANRDLVSPEPVSLNALLLRIQEELLSVLGPEVDLELVLDDDLPWTHLDLGQTEQAVRNLVENAVEALPGGGTIEVQTLRSGIGPGIPEWVCLRVSDDGVGMDPPTVSKAFEPFFTTKEAGMGLGLSMVHGFVMRHGGRVTCESEPGRGTTLQLCFPAKDEGVEEGGETSSAEGRKRLVSSGRGESASEGGL